MQESQLLLLLLVRTFDAYTKMTVSLSAGSTSEHYCSALPFTVSSASFLGGFTNTVCVTANRRSSRGRVDSLWPDAGRDQRQQS